MRAVPGYCMCGSQLVLWELNAEDIRQVEHGGIRLVAGDVEGHCIFCWSANDWLGDEQRN